MGLQIETYEILLPIALILALGKLLSIFSKKVGLPQVVGMLLSGILIGFIKYIPNQTILSDEVIMGLSFIGEIGVVLIMFEAGLTTDIQSIKKAGVQSIVVTSLGVIVPLALGFVVSGIFNGFTLANLYTNLFYGVILTATSVSITVAALQELGKLNSQVGTIIVSAAIIDDVIGVVVLSTVLSLATADGGSILIVLLKLLGFIVAIFVMGFLLKLLFKWLEKHFSHHRMIPIFTLAIAFIYAYIAEKVFGIADITGAYFAGLTFASLKDQNYIEEKDNIISYMFFTPIFFAKIGITINFGSLNPSIIGFGLCFVLAGILGKLIGCFIGAKVTGSSTADALKIGVGMMCRAEVCLICAEKGVKAGIINESIETFVVLLIILTSFITPIILKLLYKKELKDDKVLIKNV